MFRGSQVREKEAERERERERERETETETETETQRERERGRRNRLTEAAQKIRPAKHRHEHDVRKLIGLSWPFEKAP